ncbi:MULTISPECIES: alpha/beta hydrolase [Amycolatopsis]|uniref:alpha/beta hydrolase n=1 Tax=Amycolatopsis TaxID=1813 RepID=UPI001C71A3EC|nr:MULTISPECIES: alpha/beta hydrolase [Amycolatopsis]UKD57168.1 alpha/beta hydrolase [Amycolatopsis sp. FU40]
MNHPNVDRDYSAQATVTAAEFDAAMARYRSASESATARLNGVAGLAFDPLSDERLDVWGISPGQLRPVVLAIHGGYWRMLSRHDTAFMARVLSDAGIATVAPDYTLAPAAPLEEIVRQVRAAVAWVHHHGAEHGLDRERIHVVGSSAGGHLTAMTAVAGWQRAAGLPEDVVKGAMTISGLFDVRPLVDSFANAWLTLDSTRAEALSPILAQPGAAPLHVAVAEHEAAGFHRQSKAFHAHWPAAGPLTVVPGRNHFDVFLDLADPRSALSQALVRLALS